MKRKTATRWMAIAGAGLLAALCLLALRASRRPRPAPSEVQASGREIILDQAFLLAKTQFGTSERGKLILAQVGRLLENNSIVFSYDLVRTRGMTWNEFMGARLVFVRVMEMADGRYLHQTPGQIMEVLCHESVHWIKGSFGKTCLEEECDGFAAGLCALASSEGNARDGMLYLDGVPLAQFVQRNYPGIRSDPSYEPVGEDRQWLKVRTGTD